MMDAAGLIGHAKFVILHIYWIKILLRIYPDACDFLDAGRILKAVLAEQLRGVLHDGLKIQRAVRVAEMQRSIEVKQFAIEAEAGVYPQAEAGSYGSCRSSRGVAFASHERAAGDDVVQRADDFHVRVEVQPAVLVEYLEARVVRHEGILPSLVRLPCVRDGVHVEVVFVPLPYLIVRQELPPRLDALHRQRRQRVPTEPAVMNHLGYHFFNDSFINNSESSLNFSRILFTLI